MRSKHDDVVCSHLQAVWIQYCREHLLGETTGVKSLAQSMLIQKENGEVGLVHRLRLRARRLIDEWGSLNDVTTGTPKRQVTLYQRQEDAYRAFLDRIKELESQEFINAG